MKQLVSACLVVWLAVVVRGGPAESAVMAAMRVSDLPNYTWISTVSDDARTYEIEGRTTRGGFTWVKMPVINAIRLRLGRSVTDTQIEAIFKGNVQCVLFAEDTWKLVSELPWEKPDDEMDRITAANSGGIGSVLGGINGPPPVPGMGAATRRRTRDELKPQAYSNLQLAISHPHEDLGVIVSSHTEWNVEGDIVSGTLTELGAQLLLVHDGQNEIEPLRGAGTFKLWMRNGIVFKYQVALEGVISVATRGSRQKIAVRQTMLTTLRDIGTTKFDVPEEARRKLGS